MSDRIGKAARHYGKKYHEAQATIAALTARIKTLGGALEGAKKDLIFRREEANALTAYEAWLKKTRRRKMIGVKKIGCAILAVICYFAMLVLALKGDVVNVVVAGVTAILFLLLTIGFGIQAKWGQDEKT